MTETATLTLTEFLLARIEEDEAVAREAAQRSHSGGPLARWRYEEDEGQRGDGNGKGRVWNGVGQATAGTTWHHQGAHIGRWDPARVLAECEAKRRIVEAHKNGPTGWSEDDGEPLQYCTHCHRETPCLTVRLLALPYADHSDYREEWRP